MCCAEAALLLCANEAINQVVLWGGRALSRGSPACTSSWFTRYPESGRLGVEMLLSLYPRVANVLRPMSLELLPHLHFIGPVLGCSNDGQPRRIIAPFWGKPRGGSLEAGGWCGPRGVAALCRSRVRLLEGGPVTAAGNRLVDFWLCPSLESKLRRAVLSGWCLCSSQHPCLLEAAAAQPRLCFPSPGHSSWQAHSSVACRAAVPCQSAAIPIGAIPVPMGPGGGKDVCKEGER